MLTRPEAKSYLGRLSGQTRDDDVIDRTIVALTQAFDVHFGPVVVRTVTDELPGGRARLMVRQRPVSSWTSVTEYSGTTATTLTRQTLGTQPTDGYLAELRDDGLFTGWITRTASGSPSWFAADGVRAIYSAGRFASIAAVDSRWKDAAGVALVNWWRLYEPSIGQVGEYDVPRASFPTFAIPNAAIEMLRDEHNPPDAPGVG